MDMMDKKYPGYGFAKHKGYPTKAHMEALKKLGVKVIDAETPIIAIYVYEDEKAFIACKLLLERGVYVNPTISPAVPVGQAILRTSYTATHNRG